MSTSSRIKNHILKLLIVVFGIVFAISAYMLISYYLENQAEEEKFDRLRMTIAENSPSAKYEEKISAYQQFYDENNDFVGWLKVYNTVVDYPVMQTPGDEQFYLHNDFMREYSYPGTLFASELSNLQTPSDVVTIYGHNMKIGSMFGSLGKFTDPEYAAEHKYIRFDTLNERFDYEVCAVFKVTVKPDKNGQVPFNYQNVIDFPDEAAYNNYIETVRKYALYETGVPFQYGDKFILLSTCEYSLTEGRLIVMAKKIPVDPSLFFPEMVV